MSRIKDRVNSASIIVAMVALVAALGGSAVAGVTISNLNKKEKSQVKRIAKRTAKNLDRKIALKPGPQGVQGIPGPQGPEGDPAGASAVARFETSAIAPTAPGGLAQATALCESGEVAVGGGGAFVLSTDAVGDQMSYSVPTGPGGSPVADGEAPVGWRAKGKNTSATNLTWRTYVMCVKANPTRGG